MLDEIKYTRNHSVLGPIGLGRTSHSGQEERSQIPGTKTGVCLGLTHLRLEQRELWQLVRWLLEGYLASLLEKRRIGFNKFNRWLLGQPSQIYQRCTQASVGSESSDPGVTAPCLPCFYVSQPQGLGQACFTH